MGNKTSSSASKPTDARIERLHDQQRQQQQRRARLQQQQQQQQQQQRQAAQQGAHGGDAALADLGMPTGDVICTVVALYDFDAQGDGELSIRAGSEYDILERDESGWWRASDGVRMGFIRT